jgi:hypothetical protein
MFNICELHTNVCQVFLTKENSSGTSNDGVLLAVGGRYDWLVQEVCDREHVSSFHVFFILHGEKL